MSLDTLNELADIIRVSRQIYPSLLAELAPPTLLVILRCRLLTSRTDRIRSYRRALLLQLAQPAQTSA